MDVHSKIGASSMSRWQNCPGSVRLSEGLAGNTSVHAAEGTVAHMVAESMLRHPFDPLKQPVGTIISQDGYDIEINQDMIEAVSIYTEAVLEAAEDGNLRIEQKFHLKEIHPNLFGTSDAVILQKKNNKLKVFDYKHGAGVPVEVENNPQGMYYAVGAALEFDFKGIDEIDITIVQPRCPHPDGPIRTWTLSALELMEWIEVLTKAAKATEDPNAPLCGGSWCRWCRAKGVCPKLEKDALEAAAVDFEVIKENPEKLANALKKLPIVDAWVKAVREFAYREATHGRTPTGFKLVSKRPTRKWINENDALVDLEIYGLDNADLYQKLKMKTPPQIETIIGKKNKADIAHLVEKKSGGTTLVPNDDKREAVRVGPDQDFCVL